MTGVLPPNATADETAVDDAIAAALSLPVEIDHLWDAARCPAPLLPWLAWAMSVDVWRADWSIERKRAVVAAAAEVHREKGTVGGVKAAVAAIGSRIDILEWFETGGAPHTATARIDLDAVSQTDAEPVTADLMEDLRRTLAFVAPARVHFSIEMVASFSRRLVVAGAVQRPVLISFVNFEEAA